MTRWLEQLHTVDELSFSWCCRRFSKLAQSRWVRWVSLSGDGYVYALLVGFAWWLAEHDMQPMLFALIFGFGIEVPLFIMIKRWLKRPRPYQAMKDFQAVIQAHDQFSFPSGHTTAAFLFAGIAGYFWPSYIELLYLWAGLVGLSRVLLGVHYPGDIIAGAALGSALALFSIGVVVGS